MAKKFEDMTEQERLAYNRKRKIREDGKKLKEYEHRMRITMKKEGRTFDAFAVNQRKSREAALGACALKALDSVRELMRSVAIPAMGEWVGCAQKGQVLAVRGIFFIQ